MPGGLAVVAGAGGLFEEVRGEEVAELEVAEHLVVGVDGGLGAVGGDVLEGGDDGVGVRWGVELEAQVRGGVDGDAVVGEEGREVVVGESAGEGPEFGFAGAVEEGGAVRGEELEAEAEGAEGLGGAVRPMGGRGGAARENSAVGPGEHGGHGLAGALPAGAAGHVEALDVGDAAAPVDGVDPPASSSE